MVAIVNLQPQPAAIVAATVSARAAATEPSVATSMPLFNEMCMRITGYRNGEYLDLRMRTIVPAMTCVTTPAIHPSAPSHCCRARERYWKAGVIRRQNLDLTFDLDQQTGPSRCFPLDRVKAFVLARSDQGSLSPDAAASFALSGTQSPASLTEAKIKAFIATILPDLCGRRQSGKLGSASFAARCNKRRGKAAPNGLTANCARECPMPTQRVRPRPCQTLH